MPVTQRTSIDPLNWRTLGFIILSIRFVQGWIFWGGGSRRFIYDPQKLDPYAAQWMANKLQRQQLPYRQFKRRKHCQQEIINYVFVYKLKPICQK